MKKDDFIGLSFQEAYTAMRAGNKIRRHGSKGYWGFNKENAVEYIKLPYDGKEITYGKLSLTMKDCAANDWEIIPDEDGNIKEYKVNANKFNGLTFSDAYKVMKSGGKIRRHGFKGYWAMSDETGEAFVVLPNNEKKVTYGKLGLTMRSCSCSDWETVESNLDKASPEAVQASNA